MINYFLAAFLLMVFSLSSRMYQKLNNDSFYRNEKKIKIKSDAIFKPIYLWIKFSTLIFVLSSILFKQPKFLILFDDPRVVLLGCLLCLLSLSLFLKATRELGTNYSPCYDSYKPAQLVTGGVYSHVRHPIYTSNILLLVGLFLMSGAIPVLINTIIVIIFYYRATIFEEREFSKTFPQYNEYARKTKKFIPGLF
jgi:protein-S-isoprenylcysteine O-methyltransferase Ste14